MPLYEYVCEQCEHPFEALIYGDAQAECPKCHSQKLARQMSLPAKPKADTPAMPMACQSTGPPCGSMCSRFGKN
jgi:putative FmdB family regulatory protein